MDRFMDRQRRAAANRLSVRLQQAAPAMERLVSAMPIAEIPDQAPIE